MTLKTLEKDDDRNDYTTHDNETPQEKRSGKRFYGRQRLIGSISYGFAAFLIPLIMVPESKVKVETGLSNNCTFFNSTILDTPVFDGPSSIPQCDSMEYLSNISKMVIF